MHFKNEFFTKLRDCYLTRNGTRLDSLTVIPSKRDYDPTRYYKFLEVTGSIRTPHAVCIKPKDWNKATT